MIKRQNGITKASATLLLITASLLLINGICWYIHDERCLRGHLDEIFFAAGLAVAAVGLVKDNCKICFVGFTVCFVSNLVPIAFLKQISFRTISDANNMFIYTIAALFLLFAVLKHNKAAIILGILAAIIIVYGSVLEYHQATTGRLFSLKGINWSTALRSGYIWPFQTIATYLTNSKMRRHGWHLNFVAQFWTISLSIIYPLASVLLGIGVSKGFGDSIAVAKVENSNKAAESTITQIERLKALLDKDIITQEEFETKKKQIIG